LKSCDQVKDSVFFLLEYSSNVYENIGLGKNYYCNLERKMTDAVAKFTIDGEAYNEGNKFSSLVTTFTSNN
jgi:hypothetical protein